MMATTEEEQQMPVSLSVPASASFARPVRMLAANLAVLAGLSVDGVEDVRMAAEEAFVWCCATKPEACEVSFDASEDALTMTFALGEAEPEDDQIATYAELILTAVCDECELDDEAHTLSLTLQKNVDALDA